MTALTVALGRAATHPTGRWYITGTALVVFAAAAWIAIFQSRIGDARPGISIFWPDHPFNVAMEEFGKRFGGADTLIIYAEGDRNDTAGDTEALRHMEALERMLQREAGAHTALSLVPVVRAFGQGFGAGDPKKAIISEGSNVWVMFIRLNSPPGALDSLVSRDGRVSATTLFFADHRGETIDNAIRRAEAFIAAHPTGEISLRLEPHHARPGSGIGDLERWKDFLYYVLGPLLPDRANTLRVRRRAESGYRPVPVMQSTRDGLPAWIEEFRAAALERYQLELDDVAEGRHFTWPEDLEDWSSSDVDQWWDGEGAGIRAVAVNTSRLLVQDLRSREDPLPVYQETRSWTRGVELVLAGGVMGVLAAINEEVERSHLANISLIFLVIFVLHSITYRSLTSGGIILLQIMTATLVSLAMMALRGEGLNVNTLPVQAVGVGIGVDYAIYIVDRIRQELRRVGDVDEAIRIAIRTTGMAVTFTATTVVGGILFWVFSNLRFQAEMAQLLIALMIFNLIGAITLVPALYSILRPKGVTSSFDGALPSGRAGLRRSQSSEQ